MRDQKRKKAAVCVNYSCLCLRGLHSFIQNLHLLEFCCHLTASQALQCFIGLFNGRGYFLRNVFFKGAPNDTINSTESCLSVLLKNLPCLCVRAPEGPANEVSMMQRLR